MSLDNFMNPATTHGILLIVVSLVGMYFKLQFAWLVFGISMIIFFSGMLICSIRNKRDAKGEETE